MVEMRVELESLRKIIMKTILWRVIEKQFADRVFETSAI